MEGLGVWWWVRGRLWRGGEPLGGMPSTSSLAFARAVEASWGREVRIRDAERGRGRVSGVGSSGMGGEREGVGEWGMVGCGWTK